MLNLFYIGRKAPVALKKVNAQNVFLIFLLYIEYYQSSKVSTGQIPSYYILHLTTTYTYYPQNI